MHVISTVLIAVGLASLVACATPPANTQPPAAATAAQQTAATTPTEEAMTGSRIRKRNADGGDRSVKTVGARDMRDAMDAGTRPLDR